MRKLNSVMLIDDNPDDNFFHERVIRKCECAEEVIVWESAKEALNYIMEADKEGDQQPELIFLDINMPGMNGWEFLDRYERLPLVSKHSIVIVMLTTSDNPDDKERASKYSTVADFLTKPLTAEDLDQILDENFRNYHPV